MTWVLSGLVAAGRVAARSRDHGVLASRRCMNRSCLQRGLLLWTGSSRQMHTVTRTRYTRCRHATRAGEPVV